MFKHPEDYRTGKFFFFTLDDAMLYAQKIYAYYFKESSILELEIDEKDIARYLAYGVYYHSDYDLNGKWDFRCAHCIPELLLPYKLIAPKIEKGDFKLTEYERKVYIDFNMPYQKDRPKYIVNLGEIIYGFLENKELISYYRKEVEKDGNEYGDEDGLKESKEKIEQFKILLPKVYKNFLRYHKNYSPKYPIDIIKNKGEEKKKTD